MSILKRYFLPILIAVGVCSSLEAKKPNFLIIMADDCTYNDLPLYGGENAITPNIDQLAQEGLLFKQAYLSEAMCQPCRSELYSGMYPLSNGCAWNHSASRPEVKSLPHYLRSEGYRVGIAGKVHVTPKEAYPFEEVPGFDKSCIRNPTLDHSTEGISDYMDMSEKDAPFCLVVCLVEPHGPYVMGDPGQYPPEQIKLPANLADTPETREEFGAYLAEITYMDSQVGDILSALKASGQDENTLVLFTSEQGSRFPGCKWTNYNTGVHTALVARWTNKIEAGRQTDALVQYADVVPTLVDLAGGKTNSQIDGISFVPVIKGKSKQHREFAYALHNNLPEGSPYPIRSVTDGKYHYIRNLAHEEIYFHKHLMVWDQVGASYWASWIKADPMEHPEVYPKVKRFMRRPPEELYELSQDPYELNNLANQEKLTEVKLKLSNALDVWLIEEEDPGLPEDSKEALQAARKGEHLYGPGL